MIVFYCCIFACMDFFFFEVIIRVDLLSCVDRVDYFCWFDRLFKNIY